MSATKVRNGTRLIVVTRVSVQSWLRFVRCVRWLAGLRDDLGYVAHHAPIQHLLRDWRATRRARRVRDERVAAFHALPPEEQLGYIHPASPKKPPGWTLERYKETQRRRRGAH